MPFAAVGGAIAGGVASAAAGSLISGITGGAQSGAISSGQQQANTVLQPYVDTGTTANKTYADLLGLNGSGAASTAMSGFQASPGYQYQVTQGLRAVDAGAAAAGMTRSGATLKAEQTLGNNLANQDFGNYMSRLSTLAGQGLNGAGLQASTDTSAAGQQASIYGNVGKGVSNAIGSGVTNAFTANGLNSGQVVDSGSWSTPEAPVQNEWSSWG